MNPSPSLRERKKRQSRALILAAAVARFNAQGLRDTTVAQIAADAGVSEATFFNYFGSKEALFGELAAGLFSHYERLLDRVSAGAPDALAAVLAFFRESADTVARSEGLTREMLLAVMRNTATSPEHRAHHARVHARFRDLLRQGQQQGQVRSDWPAGFLAEMVTGAFNEVITHWMMTPDYPLRECLDQAGRFISEALAPR